MKANDFRELTTEELEAKLKELKGELFNLRFSHATNQLSNPMALNNTKKDIARVMTLLKERQISSNAQ